MTSDEELIATYVPEAGDLEYYAALTLAEERDRKAAEQLRLDFEGS